MDTRPRLLHCPLEPYQARYTEFLQRWEQRAFAKRFQLTAVEPPQKESTVALSITEGEVLDSVQRPTWALRQSIELLKMAPHLGRIYFSDFYHPGLDAIAYSRSSYRAFSFLWAQTFDRYDFTCRFQDWMRPWEVMAFEIYERVYVACDMLKELIVTALPHVEEKVAVVGLPFNSQHVFSQLGQAPSTKNFDCVYSSRFDTEKNPGAFLDLVDRCPELEFAVCTGHSSLRGTDDKSVRRAKQLQDKKRLHIFENCAKAEYYRILASSRVQFNCALQDWVSFTLLEALTFGCVPLYPMWRAFPDTLLHNTHYLYPPSENGAVSSSVVEQLKSLVESPPKDFEDFRVSILQYHDGALTRIAEDIAE